MAAMTPRWRTTLRLRALLRLLLEKHVPMGTLDELVAFVASFSDSVLVDEQRRTGGSEDTGHSVPRLARDLSVALIDENLALDALDEATMHDEQRFRQRMIDEVSRRRVAAQLAFEATADQGQNAVAGALDDLLAFLARGAP
jgi:hypothetical protein